MVQTDYQTKGGVELKKGLFTVMIITENAPITLNNADINELFFIEDIFKFCITGQITFNDRYNLMSFGPFTGNEKIAIIYSVGEKDRQLVFDVWKVGKIQQTGSGMREEDQNLITMQFIDPFYSPLTLRRYSRSWVDEKYSTIMREILDNMVFFKDGGARFNIEESTNKTDFIIPYWKPLTAMRYLMRRGKGRDSGTTGYLCFNNTNQGFSHNLVTMNYLLTDLGQTLDNVKYEFNTSEISAENKILEWWINGLDRNSNATLRGGIWRGYDFSTKKLLDNEFVYSNGADETVMLGRKTLYNQMDDINSSSIMVGDNDLVKLNEVAYNDWTKRYNMQFIVNLIVEGHEKRFAGQQIEIKWPSINRNVGDNVTFNDLLQGKYLIKSVTHSFNPGSTFYYKQRLVLIKNAYNDINSKVLYKATKMNLFREEQTQQIIRR